MGKRKRRKKGRARGCLLVFLTIIICVVSLHYVQYKWTALHVPYGEKIKENDYDWSRLTIDEKGRKQYTNQEDESAFVGIDVSKYQGDIDWGKVKNDGIEFAIIRGGYRGAGNGEIVLDEKFLENIQQAADVGIKIGVYFFSQAITEAEAIEEANFLLEHTKEYTITYPFVFDMEEFVTEENRIDTLTIAERMAITHAFCDTIQASGKKVMIYGGNSWLLYRLQPSEIQQYDLWLAQYSGEPSYPYQFQIWQYSDAGMVDGIATKVDMNLSFYDYSKNEDNETERTGD
ncbi:lysozyme M1 precursor [Anaerotignum neopropionicum]|uniref:Lysozyme M1 n=1 Tax=Anaerotignum neopropionicum TaxID=36847 RepID=A0A136WD42_9FIRM|nr:glycoside hydrolase family 25 protein [Anaerotignum neopropionicum]KXL52428.1 lysozyme M1 precursor [Anaerotignum neopropionicum]